MIRVPTKKDLAEFGVFGADSSLAVKEDSTTTAPQVSPTPPPLGVSQSIYDGDAKDEDGPLEGQWQTLDIPSPAFLVALYIKAFREGKHNLYEWQKERLAEIADSNKTATTHKTYKLALCAANGSGKDYIIVAPTIVWMSLVNIRCLSLITSSSGVQLSAQTEGYIKALCEAINEYHQAPIFRIRQRFIKCNLSGSEIRLFATDEAGKAEGYHPLEPDAKMVIVVNEAKSVSEEIFGALRRCTGYTHWLNISTPGAPTGSFHRACTNPNLGFKYCHVNYTQCSGHMSEAERMADLAELGINSALYRSKWLALFTTIDTNALITTEVLEKLVGDRVPVSHESWPLRIGGDIAAGGDENALIATRGNIIVREEAMREKDTTITAEWFDRLFADLGIQKNHEHIYMDDGGVGHAVIDMLRRKGWEIRRVRNETKAVQPRHYGNRGAELWYAVKRLAEEGILRLDNASPRLLEQLVSRQYKKANMGGRIFLESKKEAKAEGRPSPDRADALVLSFCGLNLDDFLKDQTPADEKAVKQSKVFTSNEDLEKHLYDQEFEDAESSDTKRIYHSLNRAMNLPRTQESKYATN